MALVVTLSLNAHPYACMSVCMSVCVCMFIASRIGNNNYNAQQLRRRTTKATASNRTDVNIIVLCVFERGDTLTNKPHRSGSSSTEGILAEIFTNKLLNTKQKSFLVRENSK